ncbi:hypothetical protein QHH03_27885, partial [Aphanizomenon sp. 202]|nr:hypothetical protein [Aphanizomenon sp. 202]
MLYPYTSGFFVIWQKFKPHPCLVYPQISNLIYKQIRHPVNSEILEILIWLAPRYAIRQLITVKL